MTTSGSFFTFFRPAYRRIEHNVKAKVHFKRKEIIRQKTKSIRENAKIPLKLFFKNQFEHSLKRKGQELLTM